MHNRFSGTIGLIVPTIDNAIFAEFIQAFSVRLGEHKRTMLIASHGYDLALELPIVRSLLDRRIDGVVVVGFDHAPGIVPMLHDRYVPVLSVWNYDKESKLPCVGPRNFDAGERITRHLIELNHRDIACIFPEPLANDRARDRAAGAMHAISRGNLSMNPDRVLKCAYDIGEAKKLAIKLLSRNAPTAIVAGNDIIAHGVIYAAHALGLKLPTDLSIAGIGDFAGSAEIEPGLTTIRIPARRIGRLAADTIVDMSITGRNPDPFHQLVDTNLLVRRSTARLL